MGRTSRRFSTLKIVARDVAALQMLLAASMLLPALVSVVYSEFYSAASFLVAAAVTGACGALGHRLCRDAAEPERLHAMLVAGAGWFVSAAFGALPFCIAARITPAEVAAGFLPAGADYPSSLADFAHPLHAFFESMSAYTTTGLTVAVHEPTLGRGLLFYRSLAQWIGGAGVVVLSLAIIPRPSVAGELELYQSETSGAKLRPTIIGTARAIWRTYAGLTLTACIYLAAGTYVLLPDYGLSNTLFDAVNHAMAGQSTGGFSPLDDSIAQYGSAAMEALYVPPMILGAISLPLYYAFFRSKSWRVFWEDPQLRAMVVLIVSCSIAIVLLLSDAGLPHPLREGVFQVISALSTTGWQTSDVGGWSDAAALLLSLGPMLVGGAAGATVGGVKLIRLCLLLVAAEWRVKKTLLPTEAVVPFRIGSRYLPAGQAQREVADAGVFSFVYLLILTLAILLVSWRASSEFTLADVVLECVSAQSTVGLSAGITGPRMPVFVEWVFIVQMWLGRLEVFPVIVLIRTLFWWPLGRR